MVAPSSRAPRTGTLRTAAAALGVLLIAALPVLLYAGQQLAATRLGDALSAGLGLPVSVEGIWATPRPSLVIAGLSVGGQQPLLAVHRTEILFELRPTLRPRVKEVRLNSPVLHVTDGRLSRWLRQPGPPMARRASSTSAIGAPRRSMPELVIEDGSVRIERRLAGHRITLRSSGITLRPGSPARLLLGATRVTREGELLFDAAALALDLDRARGFRPLRAALLGGSVRLPGGGVLTLHSLALRPSGRGYRLQGIAKPAGRDSGRITWEAALDERLRPSAPGGLELTLRQVAVTRVAPGLERLGLRLGKSRLDGKIRAVAEEGQLRLQARLTADEILVEERLIARQPVGPFAAELQGTALVDAERGEIHLEDLSVGSRGITLAVRGQLRRQRGRTSLSVDARLPTSPCQQVLSALPPGLAPSLLGMGVEGKVGLTARLQLTTDNLEATEVDLVPDPIGCKVTADAPHADVRALLRPLTIRVAGARGAGADLVLGPKNPDFRPIGRIAAPVREAFVAAEDSHFWSHRGFDPKQLRRAFINNLKEGRLSRGASTISQQLIKNIYLGHQRTLSRKLQEAVLTWRLEQVVPKQRILELYLNLVEMGPGIYGVGQAARTYFKEDVRHLGPLEAAKLAALTPSPRHLAQRLLEGNPGEAMRERVQTLLRLMRRRAASSTRQATGEPPPDIAAVLQ